MSTRKNGHTFTTLIASVLLIPFESGFETLMMLASVTFPDDISAMQHALHIASEGIGLVEPNPAVGAVITDSSGRLIAEGAHPKFGGPHAEIVALQAAGDASVGSTIYVTLEPCSHFGKTPPCADALISAGISRVVVGTVDPAPHVSGAGISKLRKAGIEVEVGVCATAAQNLIAPFTKLYTKQLPFIHAKWAMTMDGRIATQTGSSQWISNPASREIVHQLRGRMDAIITGIGTVLADDPLLTARPQGLRTPVRVVLDREARLPLDSQLATTVDSVPVLLFVGPEANSKRVDKIREQGVETLTVSVNKETGRLELLEVLSELGKRQITNAFLECGSSLMGSFLDSRQIDEAHCFIAPKIIGGKNSVPPIGGDGVKLMSDAISLKDPQFEMVEDNIYIHGRINHESLPE